MENRRHGRINIQLMVVDLGPTTSFPNLSAGTHSVTVRDANGCEFTDEVNIPTSDGPTSIDVTPTDAVTNAAIHNGSQS